MSARSFTVSVTPYKAATLTGIVVRTDMEKAYMDCSALWERFSPRLEEFFKNGLEAQGSYGLSTTVDIEAGIFDYWAALPLPPGTPTPEGMQTVELPAGDYAFCEVSSLEEIQAAYQHLYMEWLPSQKEYQLNTEAPCFEFYGKNYICDGSFAIYIPVKKA